jgi:hypothetical protein
MPPRLWAAALFGLLALLSPLAGSGAAPAIGIVTMDPGAEYWARFGHNAVLVDRRDGSEPTFYNFGYFDFEQPGFLARFLRGHMRYLAVALPMSRDLGNYAQEGRGARLQWLDLDPEQAQRLASALAEHVRPENAEYRYDYFTNNCSTKVRDALDEALGGALKRQLGGRSEGQTYRFEALRHGAGIAWLHLGMHLGLGPYADRPLSLWQLGFIPARLEAALREVRHDDGRPLVRSEHQLLPPRGAPAAPAPPNWTLPALGLGLLMAGALAWAARSRHGTLLLAGWFGLGGMIGLGLLALWLFTAHESAWANRNLLLLNPLALLLVPACLSRWRRGLDARGGLIAMAAGALAAVAVFGLVLAQMPKSPQQNLEWILLLLPAQLALALALRQPRATA